MQAVANITTGAEERCLGVYVDGAKEPILVPLLNELPRKQFRELTRALVAVNNGESNDDGEELLEDYFAGYLGREVVDGMKNSEFVALVKQWSEASQADIGVSLGES